MILYINTSGKNCELALLKEGLVLQQIIHEVAMQHSTVLHTLIDQLLERQAIKLKDVTAIGIMNGPGSYTGLRIGLAAAKGYCYALDIPLILFNKLELSCNYYSNEHNLTQEYIAFIEPARTGEFFFCLKKGKDDIIAPSVYDTVDIISALKKYSNHILLCSISEGNEEISTKIIQMDIPLSYISRYLSNCLVANNLDELFTSEPFYMKKVHANTPKKRF